MVWFCLGMVYVFFPGSDEVLANGSGMVHPTHCPTRGDITVFSGESLHDVFNGVIPTVLRCDFAAIKATRPKLIASLYVHRARFEARVLHWVRAFESLLSRWDCCHAMQRYQNT